MKKKVLSILLIIFTLFVNACSCDNFNVDTYLSAVKNFNNSTGFSYELIVTSETEGENKYYLEEGIHQYRVTPTRIVENFLSEMKKYEISKDNLSGNGAPVQIYELNRYFKGEEGKFYVEDNNRKYPPEETTYENLYKNDSRYNLNNLIPTFSKDFIGDFNIEEHSNKDGYSVATFKATCPVGVKCTDEIVSYKVVINKRFYFDSIEFSFYSKEETSQIVNGQNVTSTIVTKYTYQYTFHAYNGDVKISFPDDLVNY